MAETKPKITKRPNLWLVRLARIPFLLMGIASVVFGIWGGLIRIPVIIPLPVNHANWITFHGPLMVCGFLGTVIALERAVGLRSWWTYAAPLLTGIGALMIASGTLGKAPVVCITAGSAVFVAVALRVVMLQKALFTSVMALAGVTWLVGNVLWLNGWSFNRIVLWWIAFPALTILGERLDLSRFQKPSKASRPLLYLVLGVFLLGVCLSSVRQVVGERATGLGLLLMACWLGAFDIARRAVKQSGLTRFMAACLLSGYVWLALAGGLMLWASPLESGSKYDAVLHSFFVGFVFAMIFGHAPIIFPAVLNVQPAFRSFLYIPIVLLHLGLILRVAGDLANSATWRQWGASGNAIAVGAFLLATVVNLSFPQKTRPRR